MNLSKTVANFFQPKKKKKASIFLPLLQRFPIQTNKTSKKISHLNIFLQKILLKENPQDLRKNPRANFENPLEFKATKLNQDQASSNIQTLKINHKQ